VPLGRGFRPTKDQLLIRELILQLKRGYLEVDYFQEKFDVNILEKWKTEFAQHATDEMLTLNDSKVELTRKGYMHADALLPVFFRYT